MMPSRRLIKTVSNPSLAKERSRLMHTRDNGRRAALLQSHTSAQGRDLPAMVTAPEAQHNRSNK